MTFLLVLSISDALTRLPFFARCQRLRRARFRFLAPLRHGPQGQDIPDLIFCKSRLKFDVTSHYQLTQRALSFTHSPLTLPMPWYQFNARWISYAHTGFAYAAFLSALIVGMYLHFEKIVRNEHYGYPQEWFPSVSATIGDRYPERSCFMLFIALTSGPRFALIFLNYLNTHQRGLLAKSVAAVGLFRTLMCGGWTYVTSTDDHSWHDIFMISYLLATLPWNSGCILLTPENRPSLRYRRVFAAMFYSALIPMIYYFIQHKIHKVPGGRFLFSAPHLLAEIIAK